LQLNTYFTFDYHAFRNKSIESIVKKRKLVFIKFSVNEERGKINHNQAKKEGTGFPCPFFTSHKVVIDLFCCGR